LETAEGARDRRKDVLASARFTTDLQQRSDSVEIALP
jgi:hypothetical protein